MYVYANKLTQNNRVKLIATKMASNTLEEIRAMQYDNVGWVNGSPDGDLIRNGTYPNYAYPKFPNYTNFNGVDYKIDIEIWWANDKEWHIATAIQSFPAKFKEIEVTVTASDTKTKKTILSTYVQSVITLEGEPESYAGGNLWINTDEILGNPVGNVSAALISGPSITGPAQTSLTDITGKTLFRELNYGFYTGAAYTTADAYSSTFCDSTYMIKPDEIEKLIDIETPDSVDLYFMTDKPCLFKLNLRDASDGTPVTSGKIILKTPTSSWAAGSIVYPFSNTTGDDVFHYPLWPVGIGGYSGAYDMEVAADGYLPFDMADQATAHPDWHLWSGSFSSPGDRSESSTFKLTKAYATMTVKDAGSGVPVVGANVELDRNIYTCDVVASGPPANIPAHWSTITEVFDANTDSFVSATSSFADIVTDELGIASFDRNILPPSGDPNVKGYCTGTTLPSNPVLNDTYYSYVIKISNAQYDATRTYAVSAAPPYNYIIQEFAPAMPIGAPIGNFTVPGGLTPNFCSLDIRTIYTTSGYPRYDALVKVTGPSGYNQQQTTEQSSSPPPGEVVFDGLQAGKQYTYMVYRKSNLSTPAIQQNYTVTTGMNQAIASY